MGVDHWKKGKGKPPIDPTIDLWSAYKELWRTWAINNKGLMNELREACKWKNYTLSDKFANTDISQARALAELLNEDY